MTIQERFERNCTPEPNSGCWLWTGAITKSGYGVFSIDRAGTAGRAHRAAWAIYCGLIPDGLFVLHNCDNRACVNPDHLRLGNHLENMKDMRERGRSAHLSGEDSPHSRLTLEIVNDIRSGTLTRMEYREKYGISREHVRDIQRNKRWRAA